jgi:hypothetical protein
VTVPEDFDPQAVAPELPTFYDDAGRPTAVDLPAVYGEPEPDAEPRDYGKLLALLIAGAPDAQTVGRRALCLGYMLQARGAPATLADLGRTLGISRQAAHRRLTRFRAILPAMAKEIGLAG